MSLLKKEDITLLFAGNGAQRAELQGIIDKEKMGSSVIILGDVPHDRIVEYYKAVDAVMIPSVNSKGVIEATSISCLEGMGCEKPVIVSNIGGLAELITDGKNGLSVKQKDSKGLANAMLKLKKDPVLCKKLGKSARTFVVKNNSITSQTKKYLQFIKGVKRK
jgi:glycosyltransferase involved in cell wall biosynthesis